MQFYLLIELKQPLKGSGSPFTTPAVSPGCEGPTHTPRETQAGKKYIQTERCSFSNLSLLAPHPYLGYTTVPQESPTSAMAHNWAGTPGQHIRPQDNMSVRPCLPAECPSARQMPLNQYKHARVQQGARRG